MRTSQKVEEEITEWFEKQDLGLPIIPINDLLLEHKKIINVEAKKEVFDDLYFGENKNVLVVGETPCLQHFYHGGIDILKPEVVIESLRKFLDYFIKCEERHLSKVGENREYSSKDKQRGEQFLKSLGHGKSVYEIESEEE